jgi:hypothetical protein
VNRIRWSRNPFAEQAGTSAAAAPQANCSLPEPEYTIEN